ncbi:unnamed protein product [Meganyctiphanes norvegica]|uniref:Gustatory receptor n=1 Tax=Meganyctiphanes norvegica TaxID=48144 RepID=A0AAV2Q402_MEGNR
MDIYNDPGASPQTNYESFRQCEDDQWEDVNLIKENRRFLAIFRIVGLCPLKRKGREYIVNEVSFTLSRLTWFLWHVLAVTFTMWIKLHIMDKDKGVTINTFIFSAIGIFMFIIVDPVQTSILKRNLRTIPKLLNMVRDMEEMKLGQKSLGMEGSSRVYMYRQRQREKSLKLALTSKSNSEPTSDCNVGYENRPCCKGWLTSTITYVFLIVFFSLFGYGFAQLVDWCDIKDEWKFAAMMFCLVFPVLTTWFCVFFIGYQRKMYMILTKLEDDVYKDPDHVKNIAKYLETMQRLSKKLSDDIYRFTFGINFFLFVFIGTNATFEYFQGVQEMNDTNTNGDVIYVIPIALSVFHLYISCQGSTDLIQGQHDKLRYKLKGIMVELLMDGQDKQFKKVEIIYKNVKDFSPMPQVFGGFKVNYQILMAMLLFIFTYARVFHSLINKSKSSTASNCTVSKSSEENTETDS